MNKLSYILFLWLTILFAVRAVGQDTIRLPDAWTGDRVKYGAFSDQGLFADFEWFVMEGGTIVNDYNRIDDDSIEIAWDCIPGDYLIKMVTKSTAAEQFGFKGFNCPSDTTYAKVRVHHVLSVEIAYSDTAVGMCDDALAVQLDTVNKMGNGVTYHWYPSEGLNMTNIPNPIAKPAETTTYTLVYTDVCGYKDSTNITIHVDTLPTAYAGEDRFMNGATDTLDGSGTGASITYAWEYIGDVPGQVFVGGVSNVANPVITAPGEYVLTVTDRHGCFATDTVIVEDAMVAFADTSAVCHTAEDVILEVILYKGDSDELADEDKYPVDIYYTVNGVAIDNPVKVASDHVFTIPASAISDNSIDNVITIVRAVDQYDREIPIRTGQDTVRILRLPQTRGMIMD